MSNPGKLAPASNSGVTACLIAPSSSSTNSSTTLPTPGIKLPTCFKVFKIGALSPSNVSN
jgi:hypothetical protein